MILRKPNQGARGEEVYRKKTEKRREHELLAKKLCEGESLKRRGRGLRNGGGGGSRGIRSVGGGASGEDKKWGGGKAEKNKGFSERKNHPSPHA